jgi:hypothetical protein
MMKIAYRGYYITPFVDTHGRRFGYEVLTAGLKRAKFWALKLSGAKGAVDDWALNGGRSVYIRKYFAGVKLLRSPRSFA